MQKATASARSDDTSKLRDTVIGYLQPRGQISEFSDFEKYVPLSPDMNKETSRGFLHHDTAVLLCPMSMKTQFIDDPE